MYEHIIIILDLAVAPIIIFLPISLYHMILATSFKNVGVHFTWL